MNEEERQFVLSQFAKYYSKAELGVAYIEQREFGVGVYKKIEKRHLSFATNDALRNYLFINPPMYISHSTAFYESPSSTPIETKGWKGAELVFDLDAHTESKYDFKPIQQIKESVLLLVEDFILNDFGVNKKYIDVVFSGNRGYHVYIRDPSFFELGANERREVVDYVAGTGLDYKLFFTSEQITKKAFRITGPRPNEQGWRGRFAREVINALEKDPKRISKKFTDAQEKNQFISGIKEGNWSKTTVKDILTVVGVVANELEIKKVLADSAVTHDISKLIRMPNSIHGGAGLIAKPLSSVDNFEPYRDALIECPDQTIEFLEDVPQIEFANSTYGPFKKYEKKELLGPLALFLVLKESAKLIQC